MDTHTHTQTPHTTHAQTYTHTHRTHTNIHTNITHTHTHTQTPHTTHTLHTPTHTHPQIHPPTHPTHTTTHTHTQSSTLTTLYATFARIVACAGNTEFTRRISGLLTSQREQIVAAWERNTHVTNRDRNLVLLKHGLQFYLLQNPRIYCSTLQVHSKQLKWPWMLFSNAVLLWKN
jgi:hypothetical protein